MSEIEEISCYLVLVISFYLRELPTNCSSYAHYYGHIFVSLHKKRVGCEGASSSSQALVQREQSAAVFHTVSVNRNNLSLLTPTNDQKRFGVLRR